MIGWKTSRSSCISWSLTNCLWRWGFIHTHTHTRALLSVCNDSRKGFFCRDIGSVCLLKPYVDLSSLSAGIFVFGNIRHACCSFIHSFIHSIVRSFIHSFMHSIVRSFIHSFNRSFVPSFLRSFLRSFVHSFVHSFI